MSRTLFLFHNTYCSHPWGHSIIALSQNVQNLDPITPCLHLFNFDSTLPLNVQNLASTHPPPPPPQTVPPLPQPLSKAVNLGIL